MRHTFTRADDYRAAMGIQEAFLARCFGRHVERPLLELKTANTRLEAGGQWDPWFALSAIRMSVTRACEVARERSRARDGATLSYRATSRSRASAAARRAASDPRTRRT